MEYVRSHFGSSHWLVLPSYASALLGSFAMDSSLRAELCTLIGAIGPRSRTLQKAAMDKSTRFRWALLFSAIDIVLALAGELLAGLPEFESEAALVISRADVADRTAALGAAVALQQDAATLTSEPQHSPHRAVHALSLTSRTARVARGVAAKSDAARHEGFEASLSVALSKRRQKRELRRESYASLRSWKKKDTSSTSNADSSVPDACRDIDDDVCSTEHEGAAPFTSDTMAKSLDVGSTLLLCKNVERLDYPVTDILEDEPIHDDFNCVPFAPKTVVEDDSASMASEIAVEVSPVDYAANIKAIQAELLAAQAAEAESNRMHKLFDRPLSDMSCPPPRR